MDLGLRTEVAALFEEKSEKYGLEDITYGSFSANFGFRHKFCAADVVYACLSLMEQHQESNNGNTFNMDNYLSNKKIRPLNL
jgi:cell division control protein 45